MTGLFSALPVGMDVPIEIAVDLARGDPPVEIDQNYERLVRWDVTV